MLSKYPASITIIQNHSELLRPEKVMWLRQELEQGQIVLVKNLILRDKLLAIRQYLSRVGQTSLPNYNAIRFGAPNFHRINIDDPRAYVGGVFHQFSFFPWNQDVFELFRTFAEVFHLKNLVSGLSENAFLQPSSSDECTARLSFQFYPKGRGRMNKHIDPVDRHQATVPILLLSEKPKDFTEGGLMVTTREGEICVDDHAELGDVVYFSPSLAHAVETIDPGSELQWTEFQGRWMILFATNKMSESSHISNAKDLA